MGELAALYGALQAQLQRDLACYTRRPTRRNREIKDRTAAEIIAVRAECHRMGLADYDLMVIEAQACGWEGVL